jgi:putative FmdB family regulatory protein
MKKKEIRRRSEMPIYDYQCPKCSTVFEVILQHVYSEEDKQECPKCGAKSEVSFPTKVNYTATHFVAPPLATRKFGDDRRTPWKSKRWG